MQYAVFLVNRTSAAVQPTYVVVLLQLELSRWSSLTDEFVRKFPAMIRLSIEFCAFGFAAQKKRSFSVLKKRSIREGLSSKHCADFSCKAVSQRLHRFLWEQKVAKKVKVCNLFSQLSSCTLFMGAKSCEKSLETFTFDNNRAIWSKTFATFLRCKCGRRKLHGGNNTGSGSGKNMNCSRGSHNPYSLQYTALYAGSVYHVLK